MIYQNIEIAKIKNRRKWILFDKNKLKFPEKHPKISKKA